MATPRLHYKLSLQSLSKHLQVSLVTTAHDILPLQHEVITWIKIFPQRFIKRRYWQGRQGILVLKRSLLWGLKHLLFHGVDLQHNPTDYSRRPRLVTNLPALFSPLLRPPAIYTVKDRYQETFPDKIWTEGFLLACSHERHTHNRGKRWPGGYWCFPQHVAIIQLEESFSSPRSSQSVLGHPPEMRGYLGKGESPPSPAGGLSSPPRRPPPRPRPSPEPSAPRAEPSPAEPGRAKGPQQHSRVYSGSGPSWRKAPESPRQMGPGCKEIA